MMAAVDAMALENNVSWLDVHAGLQAFLTQLVFVPRALRRE
jgi:hypothetical protein